MGIDQTAETLFRIAREKAEQGTKSPTGDTLHDKIEGRDFVFKYVSQAGRDSAEILALGGRIVIDSEQGKFRVARCYLPASYQGKREDYINEIYVIIDPTSIKQESR